MSQRTICPRCSRKLTAMERRHDDTHVQHLVFCPKCLFEELGEIAPGCLMVDDPWSLHVSTSGPPSPGALRALRAVPELSGVPLSALALRLKEQGPLVLGPFTRATACDLCAKLRTAGLVVHIV